MTKLCKQCKKPIAPNEAWDYYYPVHQRKGDKANVVIHTTCVAAMAKQIMDMFKRDEQ